MQSELSDAPRLVRDRFAYIEDVNDFVLARVEDALREWNESGHRGRAKTGSRPTTRQRPGAKRLAKRALSKERLG
jgi:hypothetical protein